MTGKLPGFEKVLAATANKFANPALRYGGRVLAGGFYETLVENTQGFIPQLLQEAAAALDEDVPGVVWRNGRDGFLDGYWEKTAVTFVAVMPLAVVLGTAGFSADARAKAFAETPDLHLRVLGISADGVARIRAAEREGGYQARKAIEAELAARDPMSADAWAATEELTAQLQQQRDTLESATRSGHFPTFHRSADGWSVRDGGSGTEVGTANTPDAAMRLAIAHSSAIDEENASQVAHLASLLDAAEARAATQSGTTFDIRPGEQMTAADMAAESDVSESRILAQVQAREAAEGTGQFADIVLGSSETEFRERGRHTVNRIYAGGSVLTVFHEDTHGFFREAIKAGRLTRAETISALRAFQTVLGGRTRDGTSLRLLPDGEVSDVQLDEAVAEFMEAEILRTRRSGKHLPPGILARNLTAAAKLSPGATAKFARFVKTVREYFGVALHRSVAIQKDSPDPTR